MSRKLYVANLSHMVERKELKALFASHGMVRSAEVIDRLKTSEFTKAGLVEMYSEEEAEGAIAALNRTPYRCHALVVQWADSEEGNRPDHFRTFGPTNIPGQQECHQTAAPYPDGFGRTRLQL